MASDGKFPSDDGGVCDSTHAILRSAACYDGSLQQAGGRRVDATPITRSREVYVALYESPPFDLKVAAVDVPRLSINLVDAAVVGGIDSGRSREYAGRRYSLFFTPAHSDANWRKSQCSRHLNIYFRDSLLEELAGVHGALLCRDRPLLDVQLRCLKPWIDALELTITRFGPYADDASLGLAHMIVAELTRTPNRGTLTLRPSTLDRVRDYVYAHLAERIHVSDLAAVAGMSIGRFALSFRASTGFTPHRYVLRARIQAVRRLLSKRRYSLAEVAVNCGFSSQQHMTTVMRKLVGVTPSEVRCIQAGSHNTLE